MTNKKTYILIISLFISMILPNQTHAGEGDVMIRLRAIGVLPQEDSTVNIGGEASAGNALTPELDFTYFLTSHLATELILATSQHQLNYTGNANLGEAWLLPPTLTVQYHFTPEKSFSPYIGAGLNYSLFYNENAGTGFTNLNVDGGIGYALQGGFDYWFTNGWGLNADIKKVFLNIDATLNNGAVRADIDLDPWIIGSGVAYKF